MMSALGQKQTFAPEKSSPLYLQKQTFAVHQPMSALGQKRDMGSAMLQSGGFNSDVEGGEEKAQRCQKQLPQLLKGSDVGAASAKPNYSVKNIEPVVVGTDAREQPMADSNRPLYPQKRTFAVH